jgi:peptidoglycan/xylan/chitin deacetylase (PgdA/CDA1 family)
MNSTELPIPVLAYHAIEDHPVLDITTVTTTRFSRQLQSWQQQGVQPVSLQDYLQRQGQQRQGEKLLLLTFDDGYTSLLENALPLLERYHYPAVLFPVIGYAGRDNDWDPARFGHRRRHLDLQQLVAIAGRGFAIGNHGFTHCDGSRLSDELLEKEWSRAHQILSERGLAPVAAAWTFGRAEAVARDLLEASGYQVAFALAAGDSWPWLVPRLACYRYSRFPFSYERMQSLYSGKRLLQRIPTTCNQLTGLFQRHCQKMLEEEEMAD